MARTGESVVYEIEARVGNFDPVITRSAQIFDQNMSKVEQSALRAEAAVRSSSSAVIKSFDGAAQRSRLLGYQISDIGTQLASGTSPFLILAQQGPQVANALEGAKGAVGRFATFLSGPMGAAVLFATTMLGGLLTKTLQTGESVEDLVEKLKEAAAKAETSAKASALFDRSLEGIAKAAEGTRKALEALKNEQKSQEQQTVESIQTQLNATRAIQGKTEALLAAARAANEEYKGSLAATDPRLASQFKVSSDRIAQMGKDLVAARQQAKKLESDLVEAISLRAVKDGQKSAVDKINDRYNAIIDGARQAAVASRKTEAALRREVEAIDAARRAEIERHRDTERERNRPGNKDVGDRTRFIAPVSGGTLTGRFGENRGSRNHAGIDIAVPVGTPVKAPAAGVVIEAGNVPGYGNVIYIDHGRGTISRLAHLSKIGATKGQAIEQGQVVGQSGGARGAPGSGNSRGPHLHQEVRVNGRPVDPRGSFNTDPATAHQRAEQAAEKKARLAEAELNRRQAFENELASLQRDETKARQDLITSTAEIVNIEKALITAAEGDYAGNVAHLQKTGELRADEAKELLRINKVRADLRRDLVDQREAERKFRLDEQKQSSDLDIASARRTDQREVLQGQRDLANTQAERARIEKDLLDLQFQEERARAESVISYNERLKLTKGIEDSERLSAQAAADAAQISLNSLPKRQANARASVDKANLSPLETYFDRIPNTLEEVNEALEAVAANGLQSVVDGLAEAGTRFLKLGGVAGDVVNGIIRDLLRLAAQQAILAMIGKGDGAASTPGGGGVFNSLLQGLGLAAKLAPGVLKGSGNPSNVIGMAHGGAFRVGGIGGVDQNLLSINGQARARVSASETIAVVPQGKAIAPVGGSVRTSTGGSAPSISVHIDARDAVLTGQVRAWVRAGVEEAVVRGSTGGARLVDRRSARARRNQL